MALRRSELAKATEVALLRAQATVADAEAACDEARALHLGAVCVLPCLVAPVAERLRGSDVRVVALVSFPFGADVAVAKAEAAAAAIADGAHEVEVVMGTGRFLSGDVNGVRDELVAARRAIAAAAGTTGREPLLRAVIETAPSTTAASASRCGRRSRRAWMGSSRARRSGRGRRAGSTSSSCARRAAPACS